MEDELGVTQNRHAVQGRLFHRHGVLGVGNKLLSIVSNGFRQPLRTNGNFEDFGGIQNIAVRRSALYQLVGAPLQVLDGEHTGGSIRSAAVKGIRIHCACDHGIRFSGFHGDARLPPGEPLVHIGICRAGIDSRQGVQNAVQLDAGIRILLG